MLKLLHLESPHTPAELCERSTPPAAGEGAGSAVVVDATPTAAANPGEDTGAGGDAEEGFGLPLCQAIVRDPAG
jgi:hypothetical protein